mgnify:CR=1 FL=1
MEREKRIILKTAALFLLLLALMPTQEAMAASKKKQALKAYAAMLEKKENKTGNYNFDKFALAYIDGDSVPELIYGDYGNTVYTYKNAKVQQLYSPGTSYVAGYYKKKGVVCVTYAHGNAYGDLLESYWYYKYSKGKFVQKLSKYKNSSWKNGKKIASSVTYWNVKEKKISKSLFQRQLKKLVGTKKMSKFKFYKNTSANRQKYLK